MLFVIIILNFEVAFTFGCKQNKPSSSKVFSTIQLYSPSSKNSIEKEWPKPLKGKRPNSCRNSLQFYIPSRPIQADTDKSIEAIALSAYNLTGDQYPFTCP